MSMFIPALGGHLATILVMGQGISQSGLGAAVCRYACAGVARSRLPEDDLVVVPRLWVCAPYAAAPEEPGWLLRWTEGAAG